MVPNAPSNALKHGLAWRGLQRESACCVHAVICRQQLKQKGSGLVDLEPLTQPLSLSLRSARLWWPHDFGRL
jgi:hypothetical protein